MAVVLSSEQESKCSISGFIFALALISFGVGVYMFVRADNGEQAATFTEFETSVQEWKATYQPQFSGLAVTVSVDGTSGTATLQANTQADTFADPAASELTYPALKYTADPAPTVVADANFTLSHTVVLSFSVHDATGATPVFSYGPVHLFTLASTHMSSKNKASCHSLKGGIYDSGTTRCLVYKRLSGVCLQVEHDGSQWSVDEAAGTGCFYSSGTWGATQYATVGTSTSDVRSIASGLTEVAFGDLSITLRSSHDPYLIAERLTNDSLDFGLTASQLRWAGVLLLLLGCVLMINPVMFACKVREMYRRDEKRSEELHPVMAGMGGPALSDDEMGYPDEGDDALEWSEDIIRAAHRHRAGSDVESTVTNLTESHDGSGQGSVREIEMGPAGGAGAGTGAGSGAPSGAAARYSLEIDAKSPAPGDSVVALGHVAAMSPLEPGKAR